MTTMDKTDSRLETRLHCPWLLALCCALVLGLFAGFCGIIHYRSQERSEHLLWLADTMTPLLKEDWKTDLPAAMRRMGEIEHFFAAYAQDSYPSPQWEAAYGEVTTLESRIQTFIAHELGCLIQETAPREARQRMDKLIEMVDDKSWSRKVLRRALEILDERRDGAGTEHAE